ncbi:hypothetical protein HAX54_012776, partial [Datura stramonium]|nr:hypothetical protein [Datura stramonium]
TCLGGSTTSASTMEWRLSRELMKNPKIMKKARDEDNQRKKKKKTNEVPTINEDTIKEAQNMSKLRKSL